MPNYRAIQNPIQKLTICSGSGELRVYLFKASVQKDVGQRVFKVLKLEFEAFFPISCAFLIEFLVQVIL